MDICIIYHSVFGNGTQCVNELSKILAEDNHSLQTYSIKEIKPREVPPAELYIFSAPTRIGNPIGKMKRFLKSMSVPSEGKQYALISTGGDDSREPLDKMAAILDKKGLTRLNEGLRIKVQGLKGPLEDEYKEKLQSFAEGLRTA
jgi:flavodoxin